MKRRAIITTAILLLVILSAGLFIVRSPHKPVVTYQGKTAEQWLGEMFTTNQVAAMQAFRQMDTNAFPVLIEVFKRRETMWDKAYGAVYRSLPLSWQKHLSRPIRTQELWSGATLMLINNRAARMRATNLLPELARMLEDKSLESRYYVVVAVSSLVGRNETQFVPVLVSCVEDTNAMLRLGGIEGLERIGSGASQGMPALTAALADSNVEVRVSAARALWIIGHETNRTVPVLRKVLAAKEPSAMKSGIHFESKHWALICLHEINPEDVSLIPTFIDELQSTNGARDNAIVFLGYYGKAGATAVPALTNFLDSKDAQLRQRVLEALKKIDPETAAKYESK